MSNCSSSCKTQDHPTFGACMRSKNVRVAYCQSAKGLDKTKQDKWDAELQRYRDARAQGIQPAGTTTKKINEALAISEATGKAYNADRPLDSLGVKLTAEGA